MGKYNNNNVIAVFIQHNMNYAIKMMNCRVLLRYFVHKTSLTKATEHPRIFSFIYRCSGKIWVVWYECKV